MNMKLITALNRRRLRRKLAQERALLAEMRSNAAGLIEAKHLVIDDLQMRLDGHDRRHRETAADIARRIDREAKTGLLAAV